MTVVPGDKFRGGVAAGEVFTGNVHAAVGLGAGGEDDRVIVGAQVGERDVFSVLDATEETEPRVGGELVVDLDDGFDFLMIGGNAEADQTERRGQAVEDVAFNSRPPRLEQVLHREETRRAGTNDGNAQRALGTPQGTHMRHTLPDDRVSGLP